LSRNGEDPGISLMMVTAVESNWVEQVRQLVQTDPYFIELNSKWESGNSEPQLYQKKDGLFYYRGRILLSPDRHITELLISEHHDTPRGGHSGYERTLQRLKKMVYCSTLGNV